MADTIDPQYIRARPALLDALDALAEHRESIILIGAQAIYVHTGDAEFAVAAYTYDADLALDPRGLLPDPRIDEAMRTAGFELRGNPGIYTRDDGSQVDLLVPEAALTNKAGSRGARLGPQGNQAAQKAHGIEGALVDHRPHTITALDASDPRTHAIKVAGPAALLVAKLHKLGERSAAPRREAKHKDAFDIYRLLYHISTEEMATGMQRLLEHELSDDVTAEAIVYLEQHFVRPDAAGIELVMQHIEALENPEYIAASCVALSQDLLDALR
jgi:hypothetical protein